MNQDMIMWLMILVVGPLIGTAFAFFILKGKPDRREKFSFMVIGALLFEAYKYIASSILS
ncbi:hypothetical protein D3C81_833140 [compost metagenome]